MKLIQPNCRIQFTASDVDFILRTLGKHIWDKECIIKLLADEDTRDLILDDECLLHGLLEHRGCLEVSSHLYFYILVRNVLKRAGLNDRVVADYVAEVLAEFSISARSECVLPDQKTPLNYLFEMLIALQTADERTAFSLRLHVGNYSLFLAGLFPERIKHRNERRGFPNLRYYEQMGMTQFRIAGQHRLAHKHNLEGVLNTLGERFKTAREALNQLADRLVFLGDHS
jgi:hypothetical protein